MTQGTCEQILGHHPRPGDAVCGDPAQLRYPAMGGGYMHLCEKHGAKHAHYCERWSGETWVKPPREQRGT